MNPRFGIKNHSIPAFILYIYYNNIMSKNDKRENNDQASSLDNNNVNIQKSIFQSNQRLYNRIVEQNTASIKQSFDESKQSIDESIREARNQIPRYTETVNQLQEQTLRLLRILQKATLNIKNKRLILFSQYLPHIYTTQITSY